MFTISSRQIVGIYISKKCTNNEKCQKKNQKIEKIQKIQKLQKIQKI